MKIKKVISGITAVLVLAGAVPVFSANPVQDYAVTASADDYNDYTKGTYENLKYEKYSDHIEITGCDESPEEVVIPAEIEGLPVTGIGDGAFFGCHGLTSITIPDSVTSIGGMAFYCCDCLTSITIPNSVVIIDYGAFEGCLDLTSITIPNSVTSIGGCAFEGCSSLRSITIPESVTSIGNGAFYGTPWLEAKRNKNPLVVVNNILIDGTTCEGDVVIPESVTSIGGGAFLNCSGLTSIIIPDSVTFIGDGAFEGCSGLTSITIPDSVTSIGNGAFSRCSGLTEVTIPDSVTSISYHAFYECSNLESITIPDSVTSIGREAFYECSSLMSITILNPDCEIYDHDNENGYFNGTIRGYSGSTAQAYAEKYGYNFESIGEIKVPETLLGDANCDGEISVADATLVLQYCGNKDKYKLSEQGKINADVDGTAGISAVDALIIQQVDAGIYSLSELPLKK